MADLSAQREARRRKLTENAEARMNKLLGLSKNYSHTEKPMSQMSNSDGQHIEEHTRCKSQMSTTSPDSKPVCPSPIVDSFVPTNVRSRPSYRELEDPVSTEHQGDVIRSTAGKEENTKYHTVTGDTEILSDKTVFVSKLAHRSDTRSREILKIFSFILTAFLARFFLKFGIGLLIFKSIFLPFLVLEFGLSYMMHKYMKYLPPPSSKGTMMSAVLMLCGIKQELIEVHHRIMAQVTDVTSDLCLYLFSFIVWDACIAK